MNYGVSNTIALKTPWFTTVPAMYTSPICVSIVSNGKTQQSSCNDTLNCRRLQMVDFLSWPQWVIVPGLLSRGFLLLWARISCPTKIQFRAIWNFLALMWRHSNNRYTLILARCLIYMLLHLVSPVIHYTSRGLMEGINMDKSWQVVIKQCR